jgi:hypothetical protein
VLQTATKYISERERERERERRRFKKGFTNSNKGWKEGRRGDPKKV